MWVVEATLKGDKRHIYSKRRFYVDEDSWIGVASDEYDSLGALYRVGFQYLAPSYDVLATYSDTQGHYDLVAGMYVLNGWTAENRRRSLHFAAARSPVERRRARGRRHPLIRSPHPRFGCTAFGPGLFSFGAARASSERVYNGEHIATASAP